MISLNTIISILSERVGQPFNVSFQSELKKIIHYKRANYTQQLLSKNPKQRRLFWQPLIVEMEEIEEYECGVDLECPIFRSVCDLPNPIRSVQTIFDYVGAADFTQGFGYMRPEHISSHIHNKYTSSQPKWFWEANKLIVLNLETIEKMGVRGVFYAPEEISKCVCDEQYCFDPKDPYPISEDILNAVIRDTLNVELRNMFPQPSVVQVDNKEDIDIPTAQ